MRIAVLSGGRSSEHDVSLRSGASVATGLRASGHDVAEVLIARDGEWTADGSRVALAPGKGFPGAEVVFPVLHGPFGEDGSVQGLLECLDVPYVGSDVLASAVCIDKLILKRLLATAGVPQVEFIQAGAQGWRERAAGMGLPLWVKPSRLGSSVGITRVESTQRELDEAVAEAERHDPRVIIEAHSPGLEVECSLLGNSDVETSLPGQIVADGQWYDYEAKYSEGRMELIVPAPIGDPALALVRSLAAEVFALAGCSGMARCDFFVSEQGEVLVNEINTIPGFTETSVYAKLFEASGVPYPQVCDRLVALAVERHQKARSHSF